ncbi:hypothetical protein GCM10027594_01300 [Hymenobacter agri]
MKLPVVFPGNAEGVGAGAGKKEGGSDPCTRGYRFTVYLRHKDEVRWWVRISNEVAFLFGGQSRSREYQDLFSSG